MIMLSGLSFLLLPIILPFVFGSPVGVLDNWQSILPPWGNITCEACEITVEAFHWFWDLNPTEDQLAKLLSKLCNMFNISNSFVCNSITSTFKGEVLYVIGQLVIEPKQLCGFILNDCGTPAHPFNTSWNIILPANKPKPVEPPLPQAGSPTLRILHLSDIHYDPGYAPGTEAQCSSPLCCRDNGQTKSTIKQSAGYWGTYGKCDIPLYTVENLFQQLRDYEFDMVYWTGDLPSHNIWNQTREWSLDIYQNLSTLMLQYFHHKKVFSAVGNHESVPVDSFPPSEFVSIPENLKNNWLYNGLAKHWLKWLPNDTAASIKWRASYVTNPFPGLKVISINTQYCDTYNFWLRLNNTDPDGTLQWLSDQLLIAEKKGDSVHIIGHIPPGDSCLPTWSKNYYNIVNRFENTIRGQFFGHTHSDSFSVFYENERRTGRPTNYYSVGSSVTTYPKYNPGFKIYTIDGNYNRSSWTVLDEEGYWMNISEAGVQSQPPKWKLLYKTKESYNMPSLRPKDWNDLIERFRSNLTLLSTYISHFYRRPDPACCQNPICWNDKICTMRKGLSAHSPHLCDDLHATSDPPV